MLKEVSSVFQENIKQNFMGGFQECLMKFCFAILFCTDLITATRAEEGLV